MITFIIIFIVTYIIVLFSKRVDKDCKLFTTGIITAGILIILNSGVYIISYKNLFGTNIYCVERTDTIKVKEYKKDKLILDNGNSIDYKEIDEIKSHNDSLDIYVKYYLEADTCLSPKWIFMISKKLNTTLYTNRNNGKISR